MADAEYHRKQAEILAGLALSTSDQKEAAGLSLLAAEHLVRAEQSGGVSLETAKPVIRRR
jgi:hypothetical protein